MNANAQTQPQIEAVRRFNRFYTRRIGVLQEGLLDSPWSLTEVRVMYEVAHRPGVAAAELATDLGLDRGYLSRILRRFEDEGLLARETATTDARRRHLRLTTKGKRTFAPLDKRSRQQVDALLGTLDDDGRQRLLSALQTVERTLAPATPSKAEAILRGYRPGDIGWVVQRHGELYFREYGYDERFEALVAGIVARFVERFDPARERCWIAELDGERAGSIFLVAQSKTIAKLRLLLVEPAARGLGLGRRLVTECIAFARGAGYRKVVLWTQGELDAARHLYAEAGFSKIGESRHDSFGRQGLVAETWELKL
jgi:DNA-binding MarR family transcriptional regulator/N-acetylglutamate synthase-like GNAT family acetyltransferase